MSTCVVSNPSAVSADFVIIPVTRNENGSIEPFCLDAWDSPDAVRSDLSAYYPNGYADDGVFLTDSSLSTTTLANTIVSNDTPYNQCISILETIGRFRAEHVEFLFDGFPSREAVLDYASAIEQFRRRSGIMYNALNNEELSSALWKYIEWESFAFYDNLVKTITLRTSRKEYREVLEEILGVSFGWSDLAIIEF